MSVATRRRWQLRGVPYMSTLIPDCVSWRQHYSCGSRIHFQLSLSTLTDSARWFDNNFPFSLAAAAAAETLRLFQGKRGIICIQCRLAESIGWVKWIGVGWNLFQMLLERRKLKKLAFYCSDITVWRHPAEQIVNTLWADFGWGNFPDR